MTKPHAQIGPRMVSPGSFVVADTNANDVSITALSELDPTDRNSGQCLPRTKALVDPENPTLFSTS